MQDAPGARKQAGKALIIFLIVMAALTYMSTWLQALVVPVVTPTYAQRGALEQQINVSGTLEASATRPVLVEGKARALDILVKKGATVQVGDPLMTVDLTDALTERHEKVLEALNSWAQKQRAFDWATVDLGKKTMGKLTTRRKSLETAEKKRDDAQKALNSLIASDAPEAERKRASNTLQSAQTNVTNRKNTLEKLTGAREYIKAEQELKTAAQVLDDAARRFIDLLGSVDGAQPIDRTTLIDEARVAVGLGAASSELFPYDPSEPHRLTVVAKAAGQVTALDIKVGETVQADKPVMTMGDASEGFLLSVIVSSDEAERMAVGDEADVVVQDKKQQCPIVSIGASSEEEGRFQVQLSVPGTFGAVGLRAEVRLRKRTQNYDLLIPLSALRKDDTGDFVYMIEQLDGSLGTGMRAKRVDVYVLEKDNTRAALQSGVSQRDMLVMRSDREIEDGDSVRLKEE